MPTVQVKAQLTADDLLRAVDQMDATELDDFADRVAVLRARRHAASLSETETELLTRINSGMTAERRRRYQELSARHQSGALDSDEYEELLRLTDESERLQAHRMQAAVELARLRQVSLDALMDDLGLRPGVYEA